MKPRRLHAFDRVTPKEAVRLQRRLAARVDARGRFPRALRRVAAADCSIARDGRLHACVVVCEAPDWAVIEVRHAAARPAMPSSAMRRFAWKSRSPLSVSGPKTPSTLPASNPSALS